MANIPEDELNHGVKIADNAELIWGWDTPAGKKRAERRADYFINSGGIKKGKKILEIGCGTGLFTQKIARSGALINAIDISPRLIAKAKQNSMAENINFSVMNAEKTSFENETFDAVVGSSVLHHLNLKPILHEIKRILKKDGIMIFTEPNMLNPQIFIQKNVPFIKKLMGDTPEETAFFKWKLSRELRESEFTDIRILPFDFLHPWTPGFLINGVDAAGKLFEKIPIIKEIAGSLLIKAKNENTP